MGPHASGSPWRDGTTHVLFTPQKHMERLAALVPHPRVHLVHDHGVLALPLLPCAESPRDGPAA